MNMKYKKRLKVVLTRSKILFNNRRVYYYSVFYENIKIGSVRFAVSDYKFDVRLPILTGFNPTQAHFASNSIRSFLLEKSEKIQDIIRQKTFYIEPITIFDNLIKNKSAV
ncbi:hypothetical protein [Sulfurimonas sp. NWX79]|uniref:hypothetical protein n=2 Tax=Campylobacterales TaxID=213849 RepID=UPI003204F282|nr:hypothetical protein IAPFLPAM_00006 [Sulfurimonas phage SNW-1]